MVTTDKGWVDTLPSLFNHPHRAPAASAAMGFGVSRVIQIKLEIRKEVSRMHRGRESAPVVILAASVLYDVIMRHVRSGW